MSEVCDVNAAKSDLRFPPARKHAFAAQPFKHFARVDII
jgi:hypothetical protein